MKLSVKKGTTSKRVGVFIQDSTSTAGAGLGGLAYGSVTCKWRREDGTDADMTSSTCATMTRGTWASYGWIAMDAAAPGWYEFGIPNAAIVTGAGWVVMQLSATGAAPLPIEIQLTDYDVGEVGTIAAGAITATAIATGAIDADAIADNAIDAASIATGAITAAKFAAGAIDAAAIGTGAIDADSIASDAITAAKVAAGTIDAPTFAAGAIDATAIATGAITAAKFLAGAIDAAAIADGAIDAATFAANAITSTVIANDALTAAKIAAAQTFSTTGAVGSVTGAVASVTNAVTANMTQCGGSAVAAGAIPNVAAGASGGIPTCGTGNYQLNLVSGNVTTADRIQKNTALTNFHFVMISDTDHYTPKTGLTGIDCKRAIDGGVFAACANSATEVTDGGSGTGIYKIDLADTDLNGNIITLKFAHSDADTRILTVVTRD